jgi:predicted AAA+ superfamily ATPase
MKRYLEGIIKRDLSKKIVLLSGPRQVGKTTLSKQLFESFAYLSFDAASDRSTIEKEEWPKNVDLVVFDELHKRKFWKSWIKGIFDTRGIPPALLVTGSARLDLLRKGGDSLAGRFFSHRLHPLTVREIVAELGETPQAALDGLLARGGFPEPYLGRNEEDARRWRRTHVDTIIRGDLLDLEAVRDIKSIEILVDLLRGRVGSPTSAASLSRDLHVSIHTVQRWLAILESLCLVFAVRPYHRNVARSLLKEPKYYFYDIGDVEAGPGARLENAVAAALLREVHRLEDVSGRRAVLHYLRDKDGHEVDFLAVVDDRPVLMVEVKTGRESFARPLFKFRSALGGVRAVQAVYDLDRNRDSGGVEMLAVHDFLAGLDLDQPSGEN